MKWDVSYKRKTTGDVVFYSKDRDLNGSQLLIDALNEAEAIAKFKNDITELMLCNCLGVEEQDGGLLVFEPSDHEFVECYYDFSAVRVYILLNECGEEYYSFTPGTLGGHKKLKIYGKLDCPSAKRHIAKGNYVQHRVFFANEETAIAAGYRPCGICMKEEYKKWKADQEE